jgi:hypothetical protein
MRFLVDANLSPRVTAGPTSAGFDSVHVTDEEVGLHAASDQDILDYAAENGLVIVLPAPVLDDLYRPSPLYPGQAAGLRPILVACGRVDQGNSQIPGAGGPGWRLAAKRPVTQAERLGPSVLTMDGARC